MRHERRGGCEKREEAQVRKQHGLGADELETT